ncbi:7427_t:CDS:2 [Ambispora gerdemannii]|uniref:7427_t:CDS:1 n=1 Tax=Ambispora gerdemannii TaxID=144530 RepID=A0A9N8WT96_9GLOM|nr:7427_t:CDS:2 [Ambispora gerdemannii]
MTADQQNEKDIQYMRLAIEQANLSIPVPTAYCVGAIIVKDSRVLSSGYSRELPGNTHAEECALLKLSLNSTTLIPNGAAIYTTMEPCSTRLSGKRSCVDQILEAGIMRVVIGVEEPDHFVKCVGVDLLREKGVEVVRVKGLEEECLKPNRHVLG